MQNEQGLVNTENSGNPRQHIEIKTDIAVLARSPDPVVVG
jgi:hypothetical protein